MDSMLPGQKSLFHFLRIILSITGYTDGICPIDNMRYFNCPYGQGYYVLAIGFTDLYKIAKRTIETHKSTTSDDEYNSAE